MQKNLFFKISAIVGLAVLICIALAMINDTIRERANFRQQAITSIATDSVRQQLITGPVLVIRYDDEYDEAVTPATREAKAELIKRVAHRTFLAFPNQLAMNGSIDTFRRYRGIHQVLVYSGQHKFSGDFILPTVDQLPRATTGSRITVGRASIALGIYDVRGIRNIPHIDWDGKQVELQQSTGLAGVPNGLHAPLGVLPLTQPGRARFAFDLGLDGIESLEIVPVGKNSKVHLKSNWVHPQFSGEFLPSPRNRVINEKGFAASWDISSLATNAQQQLRALETHRADTPAQRPILDRFSVGLIEPVNVYSLAERATKYGLLFVVLTFTAFFVFEILKRLPIHPVQYLLVGLALALFFLLLLSMSEHLDFLLSYVLSSLACTVLIGFYLSFVLRDWRRGIGFGAALTLLYGALYGLLISENNALILGSLLLFVVLAAVMVLTRKVDWYQIGKADTV